VKIFGIGLSRTGTLSLTKALGLLGYKACHFPVGILNYSNRHSFVTKILNRVGKKIFRTPLGFLNYRIQHPFIKLDHCDRFDALTDTPIGLVYKDLDVIYPRSKFILTIRNKEGWLESCKKHFADHPFRASQKPSWWNDDEMGAWHEECEMIINRFRLDLYGTLSFNRKKFVKVYNQYVDDVLSYFKNRGNDLLVLNICNGEGWEKLCPFLDKPILDCPFPRRNVLD